jgi:hypothetical protein
MFHEGDIVEIPLPDGRTAIGWIIHISEHFKDAVGLLVFGVKGQVREDAVFDQKTGDPSTMKVLGPLYTNIHAIKHYGWKTIQNQPLSESKRLLTKREVAGGVYIGDQYIGSVDELGERNLPRMLVYGMAALCNEIENAFGVRRH